MKINANLTDTAILAELGARIAAQRLARNLTQAELALEAGVAKRTLERIESDGTAQWANVVRICRALGLTDNLDALIAAPVESPLALLRRQGRTRQRASKPTTPPRAMQPWVWGDESPSLPLTTETVRPIYNATPKRARKKKP